MAAARAVIFAQMVDDPASWPEEFPTETAQEAERQRLFRLIEQLVLWENTTNEELLEQVRNEIRRSWRRTCAEHQDHPRRRNCSIRSGCRPSMIRSLAAARCRWRRSGWGWRPTLRT